MNIFLKKDDLKKEYAQLDLDDLDLSQLWFLQEVDIHVEPSPGEEGQAEIHQGILLVRKDKYFQKN